MDVTSPEFKTVVTAAALHPSNELTRFNPTQMINALMALQAWRNGDYRAASNHLVIIYGAELEGAGYELVFGKPCPITRSPLSLDEPVLGHITHDAGHLNTTPAHRLIGVKYTKRVTITRRTRALGWAYSTIPTGNGTEIALPTRPMHEGTVKQIFQAIESDLQWRADQTAYKETAWFHRGKRVKRVLSIPPWVGVHDAFRMLEEGETDTLTIELE